MESLSFQFYNTGPGKSQIYDGPCFQGVKYFTWKTGREIMKFHWILSEKVYGKILHWRLSRISTNEQMLLGICVDVRESIKKRGTEKCATSICDGIFSVQEHQVSSFYKWQFQSNLMQVDNIPCFWRRKLFSENI